MKRFLFYFSTLSMVVSFTGCGVAFVSVPEAKQRIGTDVKAHTIQVKNVGDTIINKYDYTEYQGITILDDYTESLAPGRILIKKNDFAIKYINPTTNKINYCGNFYLNPNTNNFSIATKICFSENNNKLTKYFPVIRGLEDMTYILNKPLSFKKSSLINKTENYRKIELLYDGIDNGVILITYREYINDYARPAFYRQLKYTLNLNDTPTIISFKSAKIKVHKATSSTIEYEIVEPLDL